jgi:hypothetical protein
MLVLSNACFLVSFVNVRSFVAGDGMCCADPTSLLLLLRTPEFEPCTDRSSDRIVSLASNLGQIHKP